jgi:hypothetical protein
MVSFVNLRDSLFHIVKITCANRHFISVYSLKSQTDFTQSNVVAPNSRPAIYYGFPQ